MSIIEFIKQHSISDPMSLKILAFVSFVLIIIALFSFKIYRCVEKLREIEAITKITPEIIEEKRKTRKSLSLYIFVVKSNIMMLLMLLMLLSGNIIAFAISVLILDLTFRYIRLKIRTSIRNA